MGPFGGRKWIRRKRNKKKGGLSGGNDYYNPCLGEGLSERIMRDYYNPCLGEGLWQKKFVFFFIYTLTPIWEKVHNFFFSGNEFIVFYFREANTKWKYDNFFAFVWIVRTIKPLQPKIVFKFIFLVRLYRNPTVHKKNCIDFLLLILYNIFLLVTYT